MYAQVDTDLPRHPKSLRLASLLKEPRAWTRMVELWLWAMEYALDGDLSRFTDDEIAQAMGYNLETEKKECLRKFLIQSGFLDEDSKIHDWKDRAKLLKQKRLAMRRLRSSRGKRVTSTLPVVAPDKEKEKERIEDQTLMVATTPGDRDPVLPLQGATLAQERKDHAKTSRNGGRGAQVKKVEPCAACWRILAALERLGGPVFRLGPGKTTYPKIHPRHEEHGEEACLLIVKVCGARLAASEDPKFRTFARPRTLFGAENFLDYLAEAQAKTSRADRKETRPYDPDRKNRLLPEVKP